MARKKRNIKLKINDIITILPDAVIYNTMTPYAQWIYDGQFKILDIHGDRVVFGNIDTNKLVSATYTKYITKIDK